VIRVLGGLVAIVIGSAALDQAEKGLVHPDASLGCGLCGLPVQHPEFTDLCDSCDDLYVRSQDA